ncbi:hypothetical protein DFJ77DRAFT_166714 [Powellomyces hirtus]|nr:hypothetical protein DFJ77DRAFT_166714 [Powellomyces hirtus]
MTDKPGLLCLDVSGCVSEESTKVGKAPGLGEYLHDAVPVAKDVIMKQRQGLQKAHRLAMVDKTIKAKLREISADTFFPPASRMRIQTFSPQRLCVAFSMSRVLGGAFILSITGAFSRTLRKTPYIANHPAFACSVARLLRSYICVGTAVALRVLLHIQRVSNRLLMEAVSLNTRYRPCPSMGCSFNMLKDLHNLKSMQEEAMKHWSTSVCAMGDNGCRLGDSHSGDTIRDRVGMFRYLINVDRGGRVHVQLQNLREPLHSISERILGSGDRKQLRPPHLTQRLSILILQTSIRYGGDDHSSVRSSLCSVRSQSSCALPSPIIPASLNNKR